MDSVDDIQNEEAYVEDEPDIMHGPSHNDPSNQDQVYIQGKILNFMGEIFIMFVLFKEVTFPNYLFLI